ncbi:hypothetical protein ATCC90586_000535 [Pythium insidiosum]|nr:hypothetical protein ATCC90586_000535 [Pythium insidiosum]
MSAHANVQTATSSSRYEPRPVVLPDERLLRIAREAADALPQWDDIRDHANGPGGWSMLDTTPSARLLHTSDSRVDRALFDSVETPRAPQIVPDAATAKTPSALLAEAFHQALSQALTEAKKSAIGRILRRVLGLPNTNGDSSAGGDVDVDNAVAVAVLDEHLDFPVLSADERRASLLEVSGEKLI